MENFEFDGQWWVPESPNMIVAGRISFSNQGGLALDLNGSFRTFEQAFDHKEVIRPIINGITKQGRLVALVECESRGTHISMPGFVSEGFYCHYAFFGAHFDAPEELTFHRATLELSYLPDWVGVSGFSSSIVPDKERQSIEEFTLNFKLPEEIVAETSKGAVALKFGGWPSGDRLTQMGLRQDVYLSVEVIEAIPFKDFFEQYIGPLRYFIGFGTNRPNSVTKVEFYSAQKKQTVRANKEVETPIQVFVRTRYNEQRENERLYSHDMLFSYQDIAEDFSNILERWFTLQSRLDSVIRLYFSVQQTPGMYLHQQFTNLVQAAESYHRRVIAPPSPPDAAHLQKLEEIYAAIPQHQEWLKKKLQFSHEPGLPERLDAVFELTEEVIAPLVRRRKSFIHKTAATRNYQTHYDPATTRQAVRENMKLYYLTQVLEYMVKTLLLREMGLSPERCVALFKRNERYKFAVAEHPKM